MCTYILYENDIYNGCITCPAKRHKEKADNAVLILRKTYAKPATIDLLFRSAATMEDAPS